MNNQNEILEPCTENEESLTEVKSNALELLKEVEELIEKRMWRKWSLLWTNLNKARWQINLTKNKYKLNNQKTNGKNRI